MQCNTITCMRDVLIHVATLMKHKNMVSYRRLTQKTMLYDCIYMKLVKRLKCIKRKIYRDTMHISGCLRQEVVMGNNHK